ncbi:MAG: hypothetical protein CVV64_16685 [Candidatus Wallbacteria bacterium HGW-Wallbacteria-1]|jgi:hypothetical protein|uniref:Uncharacterized protein n=1 Tax=Candidatus Wallbacteria bacterium HGW-Wallbacteria-1 TaxID=2013854 RepID=A0A2N1PKM4_9BACT|nr:MAG: hypothetical protein CVV64_16685 [Candidatus Wallbacteria bacterium HGW-Wallbacteria-1]
MIEYGIDPKQNPYFIGALILDTFQKNNKSKMDLFDLFGVVKQKHPCNIKMFLLALVWLYTADLIENLENGDIAYVS